VSNDCTFNHTKQPVEVTVAGYAKLPENSYAHLLRAVATVGPISISVDASQFHDYESGVFSGCDANPNIDINHAVQLVGYGTDPKQGDYWLVRNSWGTGYGEDGYLRVKRESNSTCKADITPHDGNACAGYDAPVTCCGQCGILYDSAYPLGVKVVG
jgi:cathepsin L